MHCLPSRSLRGILGLRTPTVLCVKTNLNWEQKRNRCLVTTSIILTALSRGWFSITHVRSVAKSYHQVEDLRVVKTEPPPETTEVVVVVVVIAVRAAMKEGILSLPSGHFVRLVQPQTPHRTVEGQETRMEPMRIITTISSNSNSHIWVMVVGLLITKGEAKLGCLVCPWAFYSYLSLLLLST